MPGNGKGTPKASVKSVFRENAEALKKDAEKIEQHYKLEAQRQWQIEPLRGWSGDPLDIADITKKFDRQEIDSNYQECLSDPNSPGTTADTQALKLQADWVAVQERAFRTRHATSIRAALNAAGRRKGHKNEKGVIQTGVVKYIEDIIKRGSQ